MEIKDMKLEPTTSIRPPRKKDKKVVKEKPNNKTNLFEIINNHTENSRGE
tara:strand:- start:272 stop:421 length:150 start_codon:yes stop_codon:yes gene_type:complete